MTSKPSQLNLFSDPTSSLGASPVNPSASQDEDREREMTAISGRKCLELSRSTSLLGSFVKMLLESKVWYSPAVRLTWKAERLPAIQRRTYLIQYFHDKKNCNSQSVLKTLSVKVTKSSHYLFRLVQSVRRTSEIESGLLPTLTATEITHGDEMPDDTGRINRSGQSFSMNLSDTIRLIPTLQATDKDEKRKLTDGQNISRKTGTKYGLSLTQTIRLIPTLTVNANHNRAGLSEKSGDGIATKIKTLLPTLLASAAKGESSVEVEKGNPHSRLQTEIALVGQDHGWKLQPNFAEWMQGYPKNWTLIDETDESE